MEIKLSGVINDSICDGLGLRYVIFTQGCPHHCDKCHNPQTHDFYGGYVGDTDELFESIKNNPLLQGVTFSGGEPFCQAEVLSTLGKRIHDIGLNVYTYTGYTYEYLISHMNDDNHYDDLLKQTDVLIDGPFIYELKSMDCKYRGSTNQRLIDVNKSMNSNEIILID